VGFKRYYSYEILRGKLTAAVRSHSVVDVTVTVYLPVSIL
jgi:hypothetical protein